VSENLTADASEEIILRTPAATDYTGVVLAGVTAMAKRQGITEESTDELRSSVRVALADVPGVGQVECCFLMASGSVRLKVSYIGGTPARRRDLADLKFP